MQSDHSEELEQLGPEHHADLVATAEQFIIKSDYRQAMGFYVLAIKSDPSQLATKERFVSLSRNFFIVQHNPHMEECVVECLRTEKLNCSPLRALWLSLLVANPSFRSFFPPPGRFDRYAFEGLKDFSIFTTPFFLLGLQKLLIYKVHFENFLVFLRRLVLEDSFSDKQRMTAMQRLAVASSLASYCFNTEYVFALSDNEKGLVEKLEQEKKIDAEHAAIFACYRPLSQLSLTDEELDGLRNVPEIFNVVMEQIDEWRALKRKAGEIIALNKIGDDVSQKVQEQYEEFPYPRWRVPERMIVEKQVSARIISRGIKALSAGCGTGHEPAMFAAILPQAEILAVDLSRTSLAYAVTKAEELNLKNITFRHGDILNLGNLPDKYDLISSSGVLHHMKDPLKGWEVLCGLLKDDGVMRIGLYSKIARRFILQAQEFIRQNGYASDAENIRRFRTEAADVLDRNVFKGIEATADYFQMSMCRDLLFHVQEHDFDIPEISEALKKLGLEFICFSHGKDGVEADYLKEFKRDAEMVNLENWDAFERKNPGTFATMYQFWCRKIR